MAKQPQEEDSDGSDSMDETSAQAGTTWSQVWHLPVLMAGMILIGVGVVMMLPGDEPIDYAGHFDEVTRLLKANNYEAAEVKLSPPNSNPAF